MPVIGGFNLTPDEERRMEEVLIGSTLNPSSDNLPHDPDNCDKDEERVVCEECGACLCEDGDHYLRCSDYVH